MTKEQRALCQKLIITPPSGLSSLSKGEFLRSFPTAVQDGVLSPQLLNQAADLHDREDLQCALIIGFTFGFSVEHLTTLRDLLESDWHYSHEDIVTVLTRWPSPETAEALYRMVQWIPSYLEYDETRALAVKAIWGLGATPGSAATERLRDLVHSSDTVVSTSAAEQLRRRSGRID